MNEVKEKLIEFYTKNNIEFINTEYGIFCADEKHTAKEVYARFLANKDKQIDICPPKSNEELQEEIKALKSQIDEIHERLCTQQEMSSTVMQHIFTEEAENE